MCLPCSYKENFGIHREAISTSTNSEIVKEGLSSYLNQDIDVKFIMINEMPKKDDKQVDKDKIIKEVIDLFGEDIVEIK